MSKILVVDDEPTIVELIEESLRMDGFDTERAYSGEVRRRWRRSVKIRPTWSCLT